MDTQQAHRYGPHRPEDAPENMPDPLLEQRRNINRRAAGRIVGGVRPLEAVVLAVLLFAVGVFAVDSMTAGPDCDSLRRGLSYAEGFHAAYVAGGGDATAAWDNVTVTRAALEECAA